MTEQEQNIAIAEACGWKHVRDDWKLAAGLSNRGSTTLVGISPINASQGLTKPERDSWVIPNYTADLNAMHEAEKVIWKHEKKYIRELIDICQTPEDSIFATAAQRAEAFLKTLNLWKEQ